MKEAESQLRSEWGPSYDENVSLAQETYERLAEELQSPELEELAQELGNDPRLIKLFCRLGQSLESE